MVAFHLALNAGLHVAHGPSGVYGGPLAHLLLQVVEVGHTVEKSLVLRTLADPAVQLSTLVRGHASYDVLINECWYSLCDVAVHDILVYQLKRNPLHFGQRKCRKKLKKVAF